MKNTVAFDQLAFLDGMDTYLKLKEDNKSKREAMRLDEGKAELKAIFPAIEYATKTFDLQPLAQFVAKVKPSAIVRRAIRIVFPTFQFAIIGDEKRPAFIHDEARGKVYVGWAFTIIQDAYASGDSVNCDQWKKAFPAPDATKAQAMDKLGKALAARMKADGLSKEDIFAILKDL
jgi:hypothetical protein